MDLHLPALTRRSFLQWSGLVSAASLAAPFLSAAAPTIARTSSQPARLSLLLPEASLDPGLADAFLAGLERGMHVYGPDRPVDLSVHAVGSTPGSAYEITRTLIASGVKLVHWLSDSPLSPEMRRLFEDNGATLLMSGAGANAIRKEDSSPAVFHHTLGYWQAAWSLGNWAAKNLGKRAWMFTSLYDSGYDTPYAFQLGFEAAGGKLTGSTVTHLPGSKLSSAFEPISSAGADFAAAFFCGESGMQFMHAWSQTAPHIPLVAGSGLRAPGLYRAAAISGAMQGSLSAFLAPTSAKTVIAEEFALLGFEAAGLIEKALSACEAGEAASLAQALENASLQSPRGLVRMQPRSHLASGPAFLHAPAGSVLPLSAPPADDPNVQALRASTKTGWSHAYLFL